MSIVEKGNIISVTGYGRLFVEPNYLTIYISIGCRSNTMKSSLDGVNGEMKKLFEMAKSCKIDKKYIHIVDLDFGPKYEWKNDERQFVGHEANQKINIELNATKENEEKAKKFISEITSLNYLNDCNIEYGLKDKKKHLEIVRELSFKNALEKAEQYASLASVRIIKVNTIKDNASVSEYTRSNSHYVEECESDSHLPKGRKVVLENTVYVIFDIEK